jgi:hypothetical protein
MYLVIIITKFTKNRFFCNEQHIDAQNAIGINRGLSFQKFEHIFQN